MNNLLSQPARPLPAFADLLHADMRAVDQVIRESLHSDVVLIRQVADYIIAAGGKRMRPMLLLLASGALAQCNATAHKLAAVVEFIHTATLLHDDVVDESSLRRGRQTANACFGNAASVLVGDFLYSRAFQMMVAVRLPRVLDVMAEATNVIAEGEVLQLMNCGNADLSIAEYLEVIHRKTAKLFSAAGQLAAIAAGADSATETALATYGRHLGAAFQLTDDILDYSGDETHIGKHLGDDLAEGKATLPLLLALQRGDPAQVAAIHQAFGENSRAHIAAVQEAIVTSGALAAARTYAEDEARAAQAALVCLPPSKYRDALVQFAAFAHARSY